MMNNMRASKVQLPVQFPLGSDFETSDADNGSNIFSIQRQQANAFHGNMYQLKMLMLFLYRGVSYKYSFRLRTEVIEAKKFDDLVFEYTLNGKKLFRLLQVKHKLNEAKKITSENLFTDTNGNYSLIKYYFSYQECKKENLFQRGVIKDITICTNIDFDINNLKEAGIQIEKVEGKDNLLDLKSSMKEPTRYKFVKTIIPELKAKLLNSNMNRRQCVIDDDTIQEYLDHLVFSVNQPNEEELGNIVKKEIGKEFDFITTENVYNKFLIDVLNWMQGKERRTFISYKNGSKFFEKAKRGIPLWFGVKNPIESFTGRCEQLDNIDKLLRGDDGNSVSQTVCIYGLGGVGKTELAKKYVMEYSHKYENKVIWINAETHQSLTDSFKRLACDKLGISTKHADGKDKDIGFIVKEVYKHLSRGKSIFVFDNAEKFKNDDKINNSIEKFLPLSSSSFNKPFILITSRYQNWPKNFRTLNLEVFTVEEARQFVGKSINIQSNLVEEDVNELSEKLQNFPLALQQAISYINNQDRKLKNIGKSYSITTYLKKYDDKTRELLDFHFPDDDDIIYCKTVYATWDITLAAINAREDGNDALEILYISSFFEANDIPKELFLKFINSKEGLQSVLDVLEEYSLISIDLEKQVFNIHRLVQQVTRIKLKESNKEQDVIHEALTFFNTINAKTVTTRNIEHSLSLWSYAEKYNELVTEFSIVPGLISQQLLDEKRDKEAYTFALNAIKLMDLLPSITPTVKRDILLLKHVLADMLMEEGKYEEAERELQKIYEAEIIQGGPHDIVSFTTKHKLIWLMYKQGRLTEVEAECIKLIQTMKMALGKNHFLTARSEEFYATLLMLMDKSKDAHEIFGGVVNTIESGLTNLDNNKEVLQMRDNVALDTRNKLATVLSIQGKTNEALKLFQQSYNNEMRLNNNDNELDLLKIKYDMIKVLIQKGDSINTIKLCKEVNDSAAALGNGNIDAMRMRYHIGKIYLGEVKLKEAMTIAQDVLEKQKQILKPDHPHILETQGLVGLILHRIGKHKKALPIFRETLMKMERLMGDHHPETRMMRKAIADVYFMLKNYNQSYNCYQELLCLEEKIHGQLHEATIATRTWVIRLLTEIGNLDGALEQYYILYETQLKVLGSQHQDTCKTKNNLAMTLANVKYKFDEALLLLEEVLEVQEKTFGPNSSEAIMVRENIASVSNTKDEHFPSKRKYSAKQQRKIYAQNKDCTRRTSSSNQKRHIPITKNCTIPELNNNQVTVPKLDSDKTSNANANFQKSDRTEFKNDHSSNISQTCNKVKQVENENSKEAQLHLSHISRAGWACYESGKLDEALEFLRKAYEKSKPILGANHPETFKTLHYLASTLHGMKKYEEALPLFQEAWKTAIQLLGEDHRDTLELHKGLANSYLELGNHFQARRHFSKLLSMKERTCGVDDKSTMQIRNLLGISLFELEEYDEFIEHSHKAHKSECRVYGPEHPTTLSGRYYMAMIYANHLGNYDKALELFKMVLEIRQRTLGPNHSDTEEVRQRVNEAIQCQKQQKEMENVDKVSIMQKTNELLSAVKKNRLSKVEMLINQGADVNTKDSFKKNSLHYAIQNNNKDIIVLLMKYGSELFQADNNGITPLHLCVSKSNYDITQVLLQNVTAKKLTEVLDAKTNVGDTSLHIAARLNSLEIVKCLLKYGATYNLRNNEDKLPADVSKNEQIISLLTLIGKLFDDVKNATIGIIDKLNSLQPSVFLVVANARNDIGCTLLQVAIINKHKNIASQILQLLKKSNPDL